MLVGQSLVDRCLGLNVADLIHVVVDDGDGAHAIVKRFLHPLAPASAMRAPRACRRFLAVILWSSENAASQETQLSRYLPGKVRSAFLSH